VLLERSGSRLKDDFEAEGFKLADVVMPPAVGADALGVVISSQIVVAHDGIGQQAPDDDQDRPGKRDENFTLAAAFDQAPVALTQKVSIRAAAAAASPRIPLR
jgi:hypothetical protein